MPTHLDRIRQLLQRLDPAARAALASITAIRHFPKGACLLRQGEVCRKSYHLRAGIARRYYLHAGKEKTTAFFEAGDLALSFASYAFQAPSPEYIVCLTAVEAEETDYAGFQQAKARYPVLQELDLLLTELYAAWVEERLFEAQALSAPERYAKLLREQPHLLQQVSLTHLASYLGISLETLSRIRARR